MAVGPTMPGLRAVSGAGPVACRDRLVAFRSGLYECFGRRGDALFEVVDALLTAFADSTSIDDDRGHGRAKRRSLRVAPCDDRLFPGARQVFRLRRDIGGLDGVRTSKEIVHGIVSLDADLAGPEHLNHYARGHWTVEKLSTLDPRRDLPRGQFPAADRYRATS